MSESLNFYIWEKYYNDWIKETNKKISFNEYMSIKNLHQLKDMKYDLQEIIRIIKDLKKK